MENTYVPTARSENVVTHETPETEKGPAELLVYDLENNRAHCLNETAAFIWKHCDGKNSVADIAGKFNGGGEDLVWLGIDQLNKENLLVENGFAMAGKTSRRELIKKVGIASVIALPLISTLAVPSNVMAAASCSCVTPIDCNTQTTCPSTVNCAPTGICSP